MKRRTFLASAVAAMLPVVAKPEIINAAPQFISTDFYDDCFDKYLNNPHSLNQGKYWYNDMDINSMYFYSLPALYIEAPK